MQFIVKNEDRFFDIDKLGYILPPHIGESGISSINQIILKSIISQSEVLLKTNLTAIFFRGSQLINIQNSDFDTIIVCKDYDNWTSQKITSYFNGKFQSKFFHVSNFDTLLISERDLETNRNLQFNIKVLSIRVYGKPIDIAIEAFKPDKEIIFLLKNLYNKVEMVTNFIKSSRQRDLQNMAARNYLVKYLLRAAFELTITKQKKFTRDITLCCSVFSEQYPQHKDKAIQLLSHFDKSNSTNEAFIQLVQSFSLILKEEYSAFQELA